MFTISREPGVPPRPHGVRRSAATRCRARPPQLPGIRHRQKVRPATPGAAARQWQCASPPSHPRNQDVTRNANSNPVRTRLLATTPVPKSPATGASSPCTRNHSSLPPRCSLVHPPVHLHPPNRVQSPPRETSLRRSDQGRSPSPAPTTWAGNALTQPGPGSRGRAKEQRPWGSDRGPSVSVALPILTNPAAILSSTGDRARLSG